VVLVRIQQREWRGGGGHLDNALLGWRFLAARRILMQNSLLGVLEQSRYDRGNPIALLKKGRFQSRDLQIFPTSRPRMGLEREQKRFRFLYCLCRESCEENTSLRKRPIIGGSSGIRCGGKDRQALSRQLREVGKPRPEVENHQFVGAGDLWDRESNGHLSEGSKRG